MQSQAERSFSRCVDSMDTILSILVYVASMRFSIFYRIFQTIIESSTTGVNLHKKMFVWIESVALKLSSSRPK